MKGRLAASTPKEVATPPDAWLRDRWSNQVCFVDAAFGSAVGYQVTVTVACYRASANSASAGRVVVRSPPQPRTSRTIEGSPPVATLAMTIRSSPSVPTRDCTGTSGGIRQGSYSEGGVKGMRG